VGMDWGGGQCWFPLSAALGPRGISWLGIVRRANQYHQSRFEDIDFSYLAELCEQLQVGHVAEPIAMKQLYFNYRTP